MENKNLKQSQINILLKIAKEQKMSDIHLVEGQRPIFRKNGNLQFIEYLNVVDEKSMNSFLAELLPDRKIREFIEKKELDSIYVDINKNRYRLNFSLTMGKTAISIRIINKDPIKIDDDFVSHLIENNILELSSGLILVTGKSGTGKTTTLANIINRFNEEKNIKIITIEDPIEYVFESKKSLIIQRELGEDTQDFKYALKSSLRQDPDVVIVGEIRDLESLDTVLTLGETGHLVLATLHTSNAVESINRIISMYPEDNKNFIKGRLASILKIIISQNLIIDEKGLRIPAFEVLINNTAISNLILNDKNNQINSILESNVSKGMITMKQYLRRLLEQKIISREEYEKRSTI